MRLPIFFLAGLTGSLVFGWYAFPRLLYRTEAQPLRFSHQTHTGEKGGMKCDDCHSFRADGSFTGIPVVEKCAGCHSAALGSTPDEKVLLERYASQKREVPWRVYSRQPDNAFFSHSYHVKLAKLVCEECHRDHGKTDNLRAYQENRISGYSRDVWGVSMSRVAVKGRPGMKMTDCERCHDNRGVKTGCLDCHK